MCSAGVKVNLTAKVIVSSLEDSEIKLFKLIKFFYNFVFCLQSMSTNKSKKWIEELWYCRKYGVRK
jgi:hypothetical protein